MNNGYATITINGEVIGLKFGMPAIREFFNKSTPDMVMANDALNEIGSAHLLYCGYKNNCLRKQVEPVLTYGDFLDYLDEVVTDEERKVEFQNAIEVYKESKLTKSLFDKPKDVDGDDDDSKKK